MMPIKTFLILLLLSILIGGLYAAVQELELPRDPSPPESGLFPENAKSAGTDTSEKTL